MAAPPLRQFGSPGTINEGFADSTLNQLYITPDELSTNYGITGITVGQIQFAMSLINSACNRVSLWVEEYEEPLNLNNGRLQAILTYKPVVEILSAAGRYGYGRQDRRVMNQSNYDYIAALAVFGSPPGFTPINVDQIEFFDATGECWFPTGFFLISYTEVRIRYRAGYHEIPARVQAATANVINNVCAHGPSNRHFHSSGRSRRQYERGGRAYVDEATLQMLEPYISRTLA